MWQVLIYAPHIQAQQSDPTDQRMRLDMPDSLVITGQGAVELQTEGNKLESAYGYALPQSREFHRPSMRGLEVLPQVGGKIALPRIVRAGRDFAADAAGLINHQGNVALEAGGRAERSGWQLAGSFGLRGGPGHRDGASHRKVVASIDAGRRLPYRTAGAVGFKLIEGMNGVWSLSDDRERSFNRIAVKIAGDGAVDDTELHGSIEIDRRNIKDSLEPVGGGTENGVLIEGYGERAGRRFYVRGKASYDRTSLSRGQSSGGVTTIASVGAEALTRPEERYGGGLGVTLFSVNPFDATSDADSIRKPYAQAYAWARVTSWLKLTARFGGGGRVERYGLWEAYRENPFLFIDTPLKPIIHRADLDIRVDAQRGEGRHITAGFRFNLIRNYPVWDKPWAVPALDRSTAGVSDRAATPDFELTYDEDNVSIRTGYLTIQHRVGPKVSIASKLRVFWSAYQERSGVSYVPDFHHEVSSSMDLWENLRLMPRLTWIGRRPHADSQGKRVKMGSYAVMDIGAQHPMRHGLYGRLWLYNIFHTRYERWEGFVEPGLTLALGVGREW